MQNKVLLLEPITYRKAKWGRFKDVAGYIAPIGMISLYNYIKSKKIDVDFIDTQLPDFKQENLERLLIKNQYKIIGIPVFTNTANLSFSTASFCKKILPDCKIVFGNIHATILPFQTFQECPNVDYIVLGEGEESFYELIEYEFNLKDTELSQIKGIAWRLNDEIMLNERRDLILNLDSLPMYGDSDICLTDYTPSIHQYKKLPCITYVVQRGCPFKCIFCEATVIHGKKVRHFSAERVIDDLKTLKKRLNIKGIYFQDSSFTVNKTFVKQLCYEMIKQKLNLSWGCSTRVDLVDYDLLVLMRESGCWQVNYGVESGNQQSLNLLKKHITIDKIVKSVKDTHKAGLSIQASFILCLPGENEKMVENTIQFAIDLSPEIAMFYLPVPYPKTKLFEVCKDMGGLRDNYKWEDFLSIDFENPVYINPLIGREKMKYYYEIAHKRFYSRPKVYWQNLKHINSFSDIKRLITAFRIISLYFS